MSSASGCCLFVTFSLFIDIIRDQIPYTLPKICALTTVLDTDDNDECSPRPGARNRTASIQGQAHPSILARAPGGDHQVSQPLSYATRDGGRAHRLLAGLSPASTCTNSLRLTTARKHGRRGNFGIQGWLIRAYATRRSWRRA